MEEKPLFQRITHNVAPGALYFLVFFLRTLTGFEVDPSGTTSAASPAARHGNSGQV
jgi:hypothetical protein